MTVDKLAELIVNDYSYASPASEHARIQVAQEKKDLLETLVQINGEYYVMVCIDRPDKEVGM